MGILAGNIKVASRDAHCVRRHRRDLLCGAGQGEAGRKNDGADCGSCHGNCQQCEKNKKA